MPLKKYWRESLLNSYFLMHKNRKLLAFSIEGENVLDVRVNENEKRFLPPSYRNDISRWLKDRGIPATRQGLTGAVRKTDTFNLMMANLGLSLTDTYWLNPVGSGYAWEDVNFYTNDFRDTIVLDLTDNQNSIVGKTNFLPSASLRGDLAKKWLIDEDGTRVLVKGNYSDTCIQSLSEVLATKIYDMQPFRIDHAKYSLIKISSNGKEILGCKCPAFTDADSEFIPAIDIVNSSKRPNDMNYFQFYLFILKKQGLDCQDFYDAEIMVDFIITNIDRHFNNFGVLRDTESLQFIKPAPVFDSGNSMFYKMGCIPAGKKLLDIKVSSFYHKEVKLLSQVKNRGLIDTGCLPNADFVYNLFQKDLNLEEEKRLRIVQVYKDKIKFFEDFQNGANIWESSYLKDNKNKLYTEKINSFN